jgi:cyclic pyranopterin phosphate synthase
MPPEGRRLHGRRHILSFEVIIEIAKEAVKHGINKIRLTGGEPLMRKNICHLIMLLKEIPGIREVALTTNGVLLASMAERLRAVGLDRINVSLDTLQHRRYKRLTRGGDIRRVFAGINAVIEAGFKNIKINMVLIPGFNHDEIEAMASFCRERCLQLQRINHYSLDNRDSCNSQYEAERPLSCDQCNRLRLTVDGKFKPCLFSDREFPVDTEDILSSIKQAIMNKPKRGLSCTVRGNWEIGG